MAAALNGSSAAEAVDYPIQQLPSSCFRHSVEHSFILKSCKMLSIIVASTCREYQNVGSFLSSQISNMNVRERERERQTDRERDKEREVHRK